MTRTKKRKTKIKSCIVINPPSTPREQKEYDIRVARALAEGIFRTLGPQGVDYILRQAGTGG